MSYQMLLIVGLLALFVAGGFLEYMYPVQPEEEEEPCHTGS